MTAVDQMPAESRAPRHARLFELIRQHNLALLRSKATAHSVPGHADAPQRTAREFAQSAQRSLLPEEQKALGIASSFGR